MTLAHNVSLDICIIKENAHKSVCQELTRTLQLHVKIVQQAARHVQQQMNVLLANRIFTFLPKLAFLLAQRTPS